MKSLEVIVFFRTFAAFFKKRKGIDMQINIDEFNALSDKRQEMSEEIGALRSKLQRAEEEILMLKEVKVEQDRIVEELKQELKQELEKKEARIMELTDIIAKSTQNVNVNVFAVITDKNMFPLAFEKFDRTFHGLPEDLQAATAGVVMKSLPTELPPEARVKVEAVTEIKRLKSDPKVEMNFGADSSAEIHNY